MKIVSRPLCLRRFGFWLFLALTLSASFSVLMGRRFVSAAGSVTTLAASSAAPPCPDFVIEGFGRNTTGGCGGRTIYVTNLNNSGAGSLRDAVSQSGPRIVKFQVSGWITLTSILKLFNSDITIDGSDAPNGGVGIRGAIFSMSANNVILRHLRFRSGVTLPDGGNDVDRDAVQIGSDNGSVPYDVVIDHCEFAWGDDGNLDITNSAHDITVQWSMIYENFGPGNMLLGSGGIGDSGDGATRITLHHNLFAQGSRNPEINTGEGDLVNNVFYRNFDGRDFYGPGQHLGFANLTRVQPWDSPAPLWNIVGNYYKPGGLEYLVEPGRQRQIYFYGGLPQSGRALLYVKGNIGPSRQNDGQPELDIVNQNDKGLAVSGERFSYPAVATSTASQAYAEVVANAGATLPCRDAVSARVMSEVISGTGRYPEAEGDFGFYGGYPDLTRACSAPLSPPSPAPSISSFTANPATITAGQSATLSWSVSDATSLTLNPGNLNVAGTTGRTVSPTTTTTYTLTATNSTGSVTSQTAVTVGNPTPPPSSTITVSPANPTFQGVAGNSITIPLTLTVNTPNGAAWTSYDNSPWFNASPTSGPDSGSITLTPNNASIRSLAPGIYTQPITFSSPGLPKLTVTVTLVLTSSTPPATTITVSPANPTFQGVAGNSITIPLTLTVNTPNGAAWTSYDNSPWFNASPTSGPDSGSITLTPNNASIRSLAPGIYTQPITFSSPGLPKLTVTVTLVLTPP